GYLRQPIKALLAHPFGQDGDGVAGQQVGVISTAPAVVAGGGPDGFLGRGVKLARDQGRDEAAEGRANLMCPSGEPLADQNHDPRGYAAQCWGYFQVVDACEAATVDGRFVVPGDAEEVAGV